jgi:Tfp pilus assembly protein PilO
MIRIIIATVAFISAGAIFFLYTQPAYDAVQASQAQIAQYNQALDKATELQTLKQSLLSKYNSFDTNSLDRLQTLLPDQVNNIGLILDLDSIASRYGLAMQNVDITGGSTATPSNQTAVGAIGSSNQAYDSLTLTFSTQGTYDSFMQFLTDLETSLRIVDLVSITVAPAATANGASSTGTEPLYSYGITLRTYWLK